MIGGKRCEPHELPAEQRADEADAYWRPSWRRDETVWFSTTAAPIKAEARKQRSSAAHGRRRCSSSIATRSPILHPRARMGGF
jgi:hypothetical protein